MTVVPIQDAPGSSVQLDDIADALDYQIDLMWALIQTIQSDTKSAPVLADAILDGLSAIRRDMDRL